MIFFPGFQQRNIEVEQTNINFVIGGAGRPILLLHGYPQTHVMWRKITPILADHYTVVATDLRGYGDSGRPLSGKDHEGYGKRASARDQLQVMERLGFQTFHVIGHDRGARVGHRLALDYPNTVNQFVSLDVVPTTQIFEGMDAQLAKAYFHWFLMLQPEPFAETFIQNNAEYYLRWLIQRWSSRRGAIEEEVLLEYIRCFIQPGTIHAMCEDYRAVSIDMQHDREDKGRKLTCPMLALWGSGQNQHPGWPSMCLDVVEEWKKRAVNVEGHGIECGHFLPEEAPDETADNILNFLD